MSTEEKLLWLLAIIACPFAALMLCEDEGEDE